MSMIVEEMDPTSRRTAFRCIAHGPFTVPDHVFIHLPSGVRPSCPECRRERVVAERRDHCAALYARNRAAAGVPRRFECATFDDFKTDAHKARLLALSSAAEFANAFRASPDRGGGMIWSGKVGTGKTLLACAVLDAVMQAGHTGKYTTILDASKRIKATYGKAAEETEAQAINAFVKPDLLVIDEIGIGYNSETERLHLWEILSRRYNEVKSTILISNLAKQALSEVVGERIMDRMREGGSYVAFDWDSYRGTRP